MSTQTVRPTERNRVTIVALWALAAVAFVGLLAGGYPTIAAVSFLGIGAASVVHWRRTGPLFDERDATIVRTASTQLVQLLGITAGLVFPTVTLLDGLGYVEWPAWLTPVAALVAALYAVWVGLVVLAWLQR